MIKTICSICEKKISEIKAEESSLNTPVFYRITAEVVIIDGRDPLAETKFILCPGCFRKTGLIE